MIKDPVVGLKRWKIRRQYAARAGVVALTSFLPSARTLLVLAIVGGQYSAQVLSTIGITGSIYGLVLVLGVGFSIHTLHRCTRALQESDTTAAGAARMRFILSAELRTATAAAVVLTVVAGALFFAVPPLTSLSADIFRLYWLCFLPGLVLTPLTLVVSGAYQSLNRDYSNLGASAITTFSQAALAVSAVLLDASPAQLVLVLGLGSSAATVFGAAYRLRRLSRSGIPTRGLLRSALFRFLAAPIRVLLRIPTRLVGAVDGAVFMATFSFASFIAVANSVTDGAVVVLFVAVMRAMIVPMKQFGLVGGRLVVQGDRGPFGAAVNRGDVFVVTATIMTLAAMLVVAARVYVPAFTALPWLIVVMMALQLLLEPVSGIGYSFFKVAASPRFGLPALVISYLAVGVPALAIAYLFDAATAIIVCSILFSVRVLFAAGVLLAGRNARVAGG